MKMSVFQRFPENPILSPTDVIPTRPDMVVECLLNPGAFRFEGRVGMLLRVAERPAQDPAWITIPVLDPESEGGVRILRIKKGDSDLDDSDPRVIQYKGRGYLTTLSHLRLAWSDDGVNFKAEPTPTLVGEGSHESFGIEDCRVEKIGDSYWLTFTAVSEFGVGVGLISTKDWKSFERHGLIFPPHNKDCAFFPEKVGGQYIALHRPSGLDLGGNFIWIARSPDLFHWGEHVCIATTRPGKWDGKRVGAGAAPIRTDRGWLAIYHGANEENRYCLGAILMDLDDPSKVIARSDEPIFEPDADYELQGFFGKVVFTNGHYVDGDAITMYYGAADSVVCGARGSVQAILDTLG
jgi:predicted GH43/DUF377 family glycosyl hydrolase